MYAHSLSIFFRSSKPPTKKEPTDSPMFYRTQGLAQPAYQGPKANNWFTTPHLPNNIKWAQGTALQQYKINQIAYPKRGWPTYPMGLYNTKRDATTSPPITDWVVGKEPDWAPIAGGKGWGNPKIPVQKAAAPAASSSSSAATRFYTSTSSQVPAPTPTSSPLAPEVASTSGSQAPTAAPTTTTLSSSSSPTASGKSLSFPFISIFSPPNKNPPPPPPFSPPSEGNCKYILMEEKKMKRQIGD